MTIVSPFDNNEEGEQSDEDSGGEAVATATFSPLPSDDEPLDLTWDNVDMVLEEMRPYLIQDGGNVKISEIDGPVVRLELVVRKYCFDFVNQENSEFVRIIFDILLHYVSMHQF